MKKEIRIIGISVMLALVFLVIVCGWENILTAFPKYKEYLLAALLLMIQSKLLSGLQAKLKDSDPSLIAAKRKLFLFYTDTKTHFHSVYQNALKLREYSAVSFLLAHVGFCEQDDKTYQKGKGWLNGQEPIPYDYLPKEVDRKTKQRLKNEIRAYHRRSARDEDLFFDCLSDHVLDRSHAPSTIELILVWLSYFYFLVDIFNIELKDYKDLVICFAVLTITDIGRHYIAYRKDLENTIEGYTDFRLRMQRMHLCMNDRDCPRIVIEGESIPYVSAAESSETTAP